MSMDITIPKLGVTMEEGTISEWLVAEGDAVEQGQPIYLLEADKVEVEIECPAGGQIAIVGVVGETYDVGDVVARLS